MNNYPKIHFVVGARPNYMKAKVLLDLLPNVTLIHTGQHFSPELGGEFLARLGVRQPDVVLAPQRGSQVTLLTSVMQQLDQFWAKSKPGLAIVFGDVNSTAAAALVASRTGIPIAHVEAGLRSRDLSMPEEVNRILTDACASLLFCTEPSGIDNLRNEGRTDGVHLVGNTMIDCLVALRPQIDDSDVLKRLALQPGQYAVCTFHRPSNVDDANALNCLLGRVDRLDRQFIYPVHPRVAVGTGFANIRTIPPLFYSDFIKLVSESAFVLTDSGGIQEETTFLGVPCLTYRSSTERPITIDQGTNVLLENIRDVPQWLEEISGRERRPIEHWDGRASERIVDILRSSFPELVAEGYLPGDRQE